MPSTWSDWNLCRILQKIWLVHVYTMPGIHSIHISWYFVCWLLGNRGLLGSWTLEFLILLFWVGSKWIRCHLGMTRRILSLLSLAWLMSETPNLLPQEREAVSAGAGQKSHLPMGAEGPQAPVSLGKWQCIRQGLGKMQWAHASQDNLGESNEELVCTDVGRM